MGRILALTGVAALLALSCGDDDSTFDDLDGSADSGNGGTTGTGGKGTAGKGSGGNIAAGGKAGSGGAPSSGGAAGSGGAGGAGGSGGSSGSGGASGAGGDETDGGMDASMGGADAGMGGMDSGMGGMDGGMETSVPEDAMPEASSDAMAPDGGDGSVELPSPLAFYTFDENTGTTAGDSSGNDLDATLEGGAGWTTGHSGSALLLDNPNPAPDGGPGGQYLTLPARIIEDCDDLTIALWMNLTSNQNFGRLFEADSGAGFIFFTASRTAAEQLWFNIFMNATDQGVLGTYPGGTNLVGEWHHVAVTLSSDTARLYFDGSQVGENTSVTFDPSDLVYGGNAHTRVGRSLHGDPYLDGAIDDLLISCEAYTADQIAELAE